MSALTAYDVIEHLRDLHPDASEDDLNSDNPVIKKYRWWKIVDMPTDRFIPRGHDGQIAEDYVDGIEYAPPIIAVPENGRYRILDGAHRHAAAIMAGKPVKAMIPLSWRRR